MLENDVLRALWDSTAALHERFGTHGRIDAQMRVVFEEVYEFTASVVSDEGMLSLDTVDEATDVIVTLMSTLQSMGASFDHVAAAMQHVIAKNDAKTLDTHFVHPKTGKITRREKA